MAGRLRKATEFLEAAELMRRHAREDEDLADAFVTLCVHAGIAAADVLCCRSLGQHSQGDDHSEALALLRKVRPDGVQYSNDLQALLSMKTRAAYDEEPVSSEQRSRALRRASRLVEAARLAC